MCTRLILAFPWGKVPPQGAGEGTYLIFFWEDLAGMLGRGRERAAYRTNHRTIQFKKAQKDIQQRKGYLHKCAVCGITDADDPNMEFRYCSKCNGYYCYCMKHINDHVHVQ